LLIVDSRFPGMSGNHHIEGRQGHAFGFAGSAQVAISSRDVVIPRNNVDPVQEMLDPF